MTPNSAVVALSLLLVLCAPCWADDADTLVVDQAFKDGCGPISCVVALRSLGVSCSLRDMCVKTNWKENQPVSFSDMEKALNSYFGIECTPAQLKPRELVNLLSDEHTVVILAVARNSQDVNHAVCANSVSANDVVRFIDYPDLVVVKTLGDVASDWNGEALVVRVSFFYRVLHRISVYLGPCFAILFVLAGFRTKPPLLSATGKSTVG